MSLKRLLNCVCFNIIIVYYGHVLYGYNMACLYGHVYCACILCVEYLTHIHFIYTSTHYTYTHNIYTIYTVTLKRVHIDYIQ